MKKSIGVMFSGGLDSTYLVWKNLRRGHFVNLYYVEIENNDTKAKKEKEQIEKLWKAFDDAYPGMVGSMCVIMNIKVLETFDPSYVLVQPPVWVYALSWIQHRVDEVQIAYVSGDDAIRFIPSIQNLYKAYGGFMVDNFKMKPLKFPLIKISKEKMMAELPRKFAEHVWSCEPQYYDMDAIHPCGTCVPCKKYKSLKAVLDKKIIDKFPNIYKNIMYKSKFDLEFDELIKTHKNESSDYRLEKFQQL